MNEGLALSDAAAEYAWNQAAAAEFDNWAARRHYAVIDGATSSLAKDLADNASQAVAGLTATVR